MTLKHWWRINGALWHSLHQLCRWCVQLVERAVEDTRRARDRGLTRVPTRRRRGYGRYWTRNSFTRCVPATAPTRDLTPWWRSNSSRWPDSVRESSVSGFRTSAARTRNARCWWSSCNCSSNNSSSTRTRFIHLRCITWIANCRMLFRPGTDLMSLFILLFLFLFLLGRSLQKSLSSVVSNRIGMKFCRNILQVNTSICIDWRRRIFDLTSHFQDGGHDVISRNKVLPPGESTRSVCRRLCSSINQFLVHSTFVLVW